VLGALTGPARSGPVNHDQVETNDIIAERE
jgi:hypothetical protein